MAGTLTRTNHGWFSTAKAGVGVIVAAVALFRAWSRFKKSKNHQEDEAGQSDQESNKAMVDTGKESKSEIDKD